MALCRIHTAGDMIKLFSLACALPLKPWLDLSDKSTRFERVMACTTLPLLAITIPIGVAVFSLGYAIDKYERRHIINVHKRKK